MIKTKHRVASALLALLLTLGTWAGLLVLAPVTAQAAVGNYVIYEGGDPNKVRETQSPLTTLLEAIDAAQDGDTIAIGGSHICTDTLPVRYELSFSKSLTLDLSNAPGKTLTLQGQTRITFLESGSLTVVGGTLRIVPEGNGNHLGVEVKDKFTLKTGTGGYIHLDGPILTVNTKGVAEVSSVVQANGNNSNMAVLVSGGGTVRVSGDVIGSRMDGIQVDDGTVEVGGDVTGLYRGILASKGSTVRVSGDVIGSRMDGIQVGDGTVEVGGNVSAPFGVLVGDGGGMVIIDGALLGTTTNYVQFASRGGTANLLASDGRSEDGYLQVFDQNSPALANYPDTDWSKYLVRIGKVKEESSAARAPIQGVLVNDEPEAPQPSPEQPAQPASPQTGDSGAMLVWLVILCTGLAAVLVSARQWRGRSSKN